MGETRAGNLDELVVYSAYRILRRSEPCTFERIVVEAFLQFPEHFSLSGFSNYPDSARVNKCWLRCRTDRGWLLGNVKSGFQLSEEGQAVAQEVEQRISVPGAKRSVRPSSRERTRESSLVRHLMKTKAFARYQEDEGGFSITEKELREVTMSTMDTPWQTMRQSLHQLRNEVRGSDLEQLVGFLESCLKGMTKFQRGD